MRIVIFDGLVSACTRLIAMSAESVAANNPSATLSRWLSLNCAGWRGAGRRMLCLKWALCAATLSAMAVSPKLWIADRPYPTVPALDSLPTLPQVPTVALSCLLVLSVLFVALHPAPSFASMAPPAIGTGLVLFDINRLQPCIYQYMLTFAALAWVNWSDPESPRSRAAWATAAFIVASIYFWSGTQKANMVFAKEVFPFLTHPLGTRLAGQLEPFWFVAPVFETSVGILLFLPRTRIWGLAGTVAMHAFLLVALGPFGQNTNSIVWPWNFWTMAMAFILFWGNDLGILSRAWTAPVGKVIVVLVGILPALNYVDRWDGYLSMSYYSGRLLDGWIYLTARGVDQLPARYKLGSPAWVEESPGRFRLNVTRWANDRMNVPPYPEPRVYLSVVERLEQSGVGRAEISLRVRDRNALASSARTFSDVPVP